MMQGLRNAGKSWLGKVLVFTLFGFLFFSFAIWGIGDIFRGNTRADRVVSVGDTFVTIDTMRTSFQQELQRLSRQVKRTITADQARAFGVDQQVLARLTSEATLDETTQRMGLAVPDRLVAESIYTAPEFQNASGTFSRSRFDDILRANGLSEAGFFSEQKRSLARVFLGDALTAHTPVPLIALEAMYRYGAERRAMEYVTLSAQQAGQIDNPQDEVLKAYFTTHQIRFKAPEFRSVNVLALTPTTLENQINVSDEDIQTYYESIKAERFGTPERRTLDQIVFANKDEAQAALDQLKSGLTFEALAQSRSMSAESLRLGTFAKAEMFDKAVADAAFALKAGDNSAPVEGRFGVVILKVVEITPENIKPLAEVKDALTKELKISRAREKVSELHDKIEDQRAAARPLADIAKEFNLALTVVPEINRAGLDKSQKRVDGLTEADVLLPAIYRSDVGVDNEALNTKNAGYIWFDVTNVEKARDRAFDEVRADVLTQWREEETAKRLREMAEKIVERINAGEALASIAQEFKLEVKTANELARGGDNSGLTRPVVNRVFTTADQKAGTVETQASDKTLERIIFRVTGITVAPFVRTTKEATELEDRLRLAMAEDILAQHISGKQKEFGLSINQQALRNAIGATGE